MAEWHPFDYNNPPDGVMWLEIERPETWCDAGDDGRTVGGYTGKTKRLVVLVAVYMDDDGVQFDHLQSLNYGKVYDDDAVRRYMPLTPPDLLPEPLVAIPPKPPMTEREALLAIVKSGIGITEGSSGHPVLWESEACAIAAERLGLTRDEMLAIAREK